MIRALHIVVALACHSLACGGGTPVSPEPSASTALVAGKMAVLAVGVATAPQGRSFFDNFLPCPRRGIIDYRNTERGRQATFTGCDAGDGVVIDGSVEIRWTEPGGNRESITAIDVVGSLTAHVASETVTIDRVEVRGISFAGTSPSDPATVTSLRVEPVRVTALGATSPLDPRATPAHVFQPTLTIEALPNAGGSLQSLTQADIRRIVFHAGIALSSLLLNETLEIQRGPHDHVTPCGTVRVAPDPAQALHPVLDFAWNACDARHGLFIGGTFSSRWTELRNDGSRMAMLVQGAMTLGGGVPKVTLSRMEWVMSGSGALPGTITVAGRLVGGTQERAFSFQVLVDD